MHAGSQREMHVRASVGEEVNVEVPPDVGRQVRENSFSPVAGSVDTAPVIGTDGAARPLNTTSTPERT
jgi:hypothetical protein